MTRGFRLKGWHVGAMISGFFVLVIATDVSLSVLAYRTFPGEVSAHPFEDGLAYNQALAQKARQARLGWRAEIADAPRPDGSAEVDVILSTATGAPLGGLTVAGDLSRPASAEGLSHMVFRSVAPGIYRAVAPRATGVWDLNFVATDGAAARFEGRRRFAWP